MTRRSMAFLLATFSPQSDQETKPVHAFKALRKTNDEKKSQKTTYSARN